MQWRSSQSRIGIALFVTVSAILFSVFTVLVHAGALGLAYLEAGNQIKRHLSILQGTATALMQYRVLSALMIEEFIQFFKYLAVPYPNATAFVTFRLIQGFLIFIVSYSYYRKLGLSTAHSLVGMSLLAWGMSHSNYDSDLVFNTYFDILFYLIAGLIIISKKYWLIIILMIFASLNRETCGLIPFMLLLSSCTYIQDPQTRSTQIFFPSKDVIITVSISILIFASAYVGTRYVFGERPTTLPYNHELGIDLLMYNIGRSITWFQLFATLGIIPFIAIASLREWPYTLKAFFVVVVPVWFLIHLVGSVMAESRMFLAPQALIFIPGALFTLKYSSGVADEAPLEPNI